MKTFTDEKYSNITGYEAVRQSAKDFERYSSNLQGDRDVRDYHQLPLEVDPPKHTDYRHAIQPLFLRPKLESHAQAFRTIANNLLDAASNSTSELDVYNDIALPYVVSCLSVIYNRPQDTQRWLEWGHDVWTAESEQRSGKTLHEYLDEVWGEKSQEDIWSHLKAIEIDGRPISKQEFFGYAGVLLAGGRDTVIKLITGIIWHLLNQPKDLEALANDMTLDRALINETLRFLSPLPSIERIDRETLDPQDPEYRRLHFASANHDPSVWEDPLVMNINRGKQPHLAFGYGPHACIGMNLAEYEAKAFISEFVPRARNLELVSFKLEWAEVDSISYVSNLKSVLIRSLGS